jgi:integrase
MATKHRKRSVKRITIKELLESYRSIALTNPITINTERYHCAPILRAFGGRLAHMLTPVDMFNFITIQKQRNIAQITIHRRISILRRALNWGVANGLLATNPLLAFHMAKSTPHRISPPSPKESKAILHHAAPHVQRVIILGMCTGARIGPSELFRLTWSDIDLDNAICRMPSAHKNPYTHDARDIPLRRALLPIIHAWYDQDMARGIHHVIHWHGKSVQSIGKSWRHTLREAGIDRRIRPYDLRHAYATYSLAAGADLKTIADIMDHKDASMILKTYQHVLETQKRDAVETMPDHLGLDSIKDGDIPGLKK